DLADGRIYWGDRDTHKIQRRRLDGTGGIEDLFNVSDGLDRPHGLDLALSEGMIYWADTQTHAIMRGSMDGSGIAETIYQAGLAEPWDIQVAAVVPEPSAVLLGVAVGWQLTRGRLNRLHRVCR
ncbi:MAG TPA: hypothetical protein VGP94_13685, partial [Tepidisphaeraceae bacterium]|nr:hypothetical protein [Tepidisphaeraceae bacterium]